MGILMFILIGFVMGLVARAVMPGRQSMGIFATTLLGIFGSLLGGLLASWAAGRSVDSVAPAGLLGSLIGSLVLLAVLSALGFTRPRPWFGR